MAMEANGVIQGGDAFETLKLPLRSEGAPKRLTFVCVMV